MLYGMECVRGKGTGLVRKYGPWMGTLKKVFFLPLSKFALLEINTNCFLFLQIKAGWSRTEPTGSQVSKQPPLCTASPQGRNKNYRRPIKRMCRKFRRWFRTDLVHFFCPQLYRKLIQYTIYMHANQPKDKKSTGRSEPHLGYLHEA